MSNSQVAMLLSIGGNAVLIATWLLAPTRSAMVVGSVAAVIILSIVIGMHIAGLPEEE